MENTQKLVLPLPDPEPWREIYPGDDEPLVPEILVQKFKEIETITTPISSLTPQAPWSEIYPRDGDDEPVRPEILVQKVIEIETSNPLISPMLKPDPEPWCVIYPDDELQIPACPPLIIDDEPTEPKIISQQEPNPDEANPNPGNPCQGPFQIEPPSRPTIEIECPDPETLDKVIITTLPPPTPKPPIVPDHAPFRPQTEEPDPLDVEPIEKVLLPVLQTPHAKLGTLGSWLPPRPLVQEKDHSDEMTAPTIQTLPVPITWHVIEADALPPKPDEVLDPCNDRELTQPLIKPPQPPHSPDSPHIITPWKIIGTDDELSRPEAPEKKPVPPPKSDDTEPIQLPIAPPQPANSPHSPHITTPWKEIGDDDELPRPEAPEKEPIPPPNSDDTEPIQLPITPPHPSYSLDSPQITMPWKEIGTDNELPKPESPGKQPSDGSEPSRPPIESPQMAIPWVVIVADEELSRPEEPGKKPGDDREPTHQPITPLEHPLSPPWTEVGTDEELPRPEDPGIQPDDDREPIQTPIAPPHSRKHTWIEICTDSEPSLPQVVVKEELSPVKPIIIEDLEPNERMVFIWANVPPEPLPLMRSVKELSKPKKKKSRYSAMPTGELDVTMKNIFEGKRPMDSNRKFMTHNRDNSFKFYDDFQW